MRDVTVERELEGTADARRLCGALRATGSVSLLLDGPGSSAEGWETLLALDTRVVTEERFRRTTPSVDPLDRIEALVSERRRQGGPPGTGVGVLLGYDLFGRRRGDPAGDDGLPDLVVLEVEAAVRVPSEAPPVLARTSASGPVEELLERLSLAIERRESDPVPPRYEDTGANDRPRTSLPRERYLRAVERVQHHIRLGDIYQANLTQRFTRRFGGDPFQLYTDVVTATPAPRALYLEIPGLSIVSASPETFLKIDADGAIETWPIKGTRPRGRSDAEDRAAAEELLESAKDRAELVMIVDLERNDLGRVCQAGSVRVEELATLRSYSTVHHLVARVAGRLRPGVGPGEILRATFPGGSITGAPKLRAIEILEELEPVRRSFYTGCFFWFGDDGTTQSSILIRTVVLAGGRAHVGAGGGIVADSEPEAEWRESNQKARALVRTLGFEPEEAA